MTDAYHQIRDNCRKGLLKYLESAFSLVPVTGHPKILDIGCGTGVPTLWIADNLPGTITAMDTDRDALDWLNHKIVSRDLQGRVRTLNRSFFDFKADPESFDIIVAEGFLNVAGFERGFTRIIGMLRKHGYLVIHDEFRDHEEKCRFITDHDCRLAGTLFLDENIWWIDLYRPLDMEIRGVGSYQDRKLFESDMKEIELCKTNPTPFRSMYYVVEKC